MLRSRTVGLVERNSNRSEEYFPRAYSVNLYTVDLTIRYVYCIMKPKYKNVTYQHNHNPTQAYSFIYRVMVLFDICWEIQ